MKIISNDEPRYILIVFNILPVNILIPMETYCSDSKEPDRRAGKVTPEFFGAAKQRCERADHQQTEIVGMFKIIRFEHYP